MTWVKQRKGWRMSCDVGKATEGLEKSCDVGELTEMLENELFYDYNYELSSFSKLSVASPTSQLILQPCFRFYVTVSSLRSPGEPPMQCALTGF